MRPAQGQPIGSQGGSARPVKHNATRHGCHPHTITSAHIAVQHSTAQPTKPQCRAAQCSTGKRQRCTAQHGTAQHSTERMPVWQLSSSFELDAVPGSTHRNWLSSCRGGKDSALACIPECNKWPSLTMRAQPPSCNSARAHPTPSRLGDALGARLVGAPTLPVVHAAATLRVLPILLLVKSILAACYSSRHPPFGPGVCGSMRTGSHCGACTACSHK